MPSDESRKEVIEYLVENYPKTCLNPSRLSELARAAVENLKPTASTGWPYMLWAKTNSELREVKGDQWLIDATIYRISLIMRADKKVFETSTAEELVQMGLCDPIRLFVKNELHSAEKVQQKRHRIIMSVSTIDQLVSRVFNSVINHMEVERWEDLASKPGMGLHDEGLRSLESWIKGMDAPAGTDVSGYDWCVRQWMLDDDASCRAQQNGDFAEDTPWHRLARLNGFAVFVLTDGTFYAQRRRGTQKSGGFNTSSTNSKDRIMCKLHITPRQHWTLRGVMAMGDDAVEDTKWLEGDVKQQLVGKYRSLGLALKEVELYSDAGNVEFCSYKFDCKGGFAPVRWSRMLGHFLVNWPEEHNFEERIVGFEYEMRLSPQKERCLVFIHSLREEFLAL